MQDSKRSVALDGLLVASGRKRVGMSQAEFAEHCHISVNTLSAAEGGADILVSTAREIAAGLGMPLEALLKASLPATTTFCQQYATLLLRNYSTPPFRSYPYRKVTPAIPLRCQVFPCTALTVVSSHSQDLPRALSESVMQSAWKAPTLLLGEYGQGKTTACGDFAAVLAGQLARSPATSAIPLLFPLRRAHLDHPLDDQIRSFVSESMALDLPAGIYYDLKSHGRCVYILDGLDEMIGNSEYSDTMFYLDRIKSFSTGSGNACLLSSRPNVRRGRTLDELRQEHNLLEIELPTWPEVNAFLERCGLKSRLPHTALAQRALREIVSRPLFLSMMQDATMEFDERGPVSAFALFERYTQYVVRRDLRHMGGRRDGITVDQAMRVMATAAKAMFDDKADSISTSMLDAIVQDCSSVSEGTSFRQTQAKERLLLVPGTSATDASQWTFRHESLQSYFVVAWLRSELDEATGGRQSKATVYDKLARLRLDRVAIALLSDLAAHDDSIGIALAELLARCQETNTLLPDIAVAAVRCALSESGRRDADVLSRFLQKAGDEQRQLLFACLDRANFRGIDLTGISLRGASLRESMFDDATAFESVDLSFALLDGAVCERGQFGGSRLLNASFKRAQLKGSVFGARIESGSHVSSSPVANLGAVNFTDANLDQSNMSRVVLSGADLTGATMKGAKLVDVTFEGDTKLNNVDFRGAMLERCVFRSAVVDGADFRGATLQKCDMAGLRGRSIGLRR